MFFEKLLLIFISGKLFHIFKAVVYIVNRGDNLKDKQAKEKTWPFFGKNIFPVNFRLCADSLY